MTLQLYWSSIGGVEDMVKSGMGGGGGWKSNNTGSSSYTLFSCVVNYFNFKIDLIF